MECPGLNLSLAEWSPEGKTGRETVRTGFLKRETWKGDSRVAKQSV